MKPSTTPILLFTCLAAVAVQATDIANVKCGVLDYYGSLSSMSTSQWTKQQVRDLIVSTHNKTLPSLGQRGEANIMDALVDLDPGTKNGTTVHVYMSDNNTASDSDAKLQNIPEGWKRGDLWPLARGAGLDTPAGTDVHAKRPIGWEVDSALFSLFWGECGTVEMNSSCVVPAVANQTANTTAQDGKIKTPPESMRGEVARSVFYNALRYGEELGITLTDCPPFNATEYGYLSTLLSWHAQYPVTAAELARNDRACSHWQGNRNPFVDQPQLVEQFFGKPDTVLNGTFMYSQCTVPTMSPTASPNECSSLSPGDVNVVIFNSDPVDQMVFFPVSDIHESVGGIFVTDKAWNGTDFVTDEGTLEYSLPAGGLTAGEIFAYGVHFPQDKGTWAHVDGTFDLSATVPDNIFVYCMNADDKPHFLSGLIYNNAGFQAAGNASYNFSETSLPASLAVHGSLVLPFFPNYLYEGVRQGNKVDLIAAFSDPTNYKGSNTPYNIVTNSAACTAPVLASIVAAVLSTVVMSLL